MRLEERAPTTVQRRLVQIAGQLQTPRLLDSRRAPARCHSANRTDRQPESFPVSRPPCSGLRSRGVAGGFAHIEDPARCRSRERVRIQERQRQLRRPWHETRQQYANRSLAIVSRVWSYRSPLARREALSEHSPRPGVELVVVAQRYAEAPQLTVRICSPPSPLPLWAVQPPTFTLAPSEVEFEVHPG